VNRFYSTISSTNKGTLFQLKQLVHHTSFGKKPKNNMKTSEDFLELVITAHVITASNFLQNALPNS